MSRTPNEELALAILLWRYVGHRVPGDGESARAPLKTFGRARRALALAKRAGCRAEYLAAMMAHPLLSVTVENLGE